MASFSKGTSFTDGVTGDVTAAKLHALVDAATPVAGLVTDRTAKTSVAGADLVLLSDSADSNNLKKVSVTNFANNLPTAVITNGTVTTLNSTAATITTGTIPTLVSTTLVTTGTGTAAAPAIVPTGDTNTGIFFPAADTIAFSEGGTEAMRIDSSGNIGIGTTSPASRLSVTGSTSGVAVDVNYSGGISAGTEYSALRFTASNSSFVGSEIRGINTNGGTNLGNLSILTSGTERLRIDSSGRVGIGSTSPARLLTIDNATNPEIGLYTSGTERVKLSTGGSAASQLAIDVGGAERLRIDSSGNVGVGTASPSAKLQVNSSSDDILRLVATAPFLSFYNSSTRMGYIRANSGNFGIVSEDSSTPVTIYTAGNERLRITSGGEVYIAGTTDQGAYNLQVNGTGVWGAGAYVNGSDSRIKEDIQPLASGLDVVEKLNPVTYKYRETWSSDQSIQSGFIAQELLTALDGQIYVDGVVQQGGAEGYYSVAYQNLIAVLTKAIQELKAENDSLKSRVTALEAA